MEEDEDSLLDIPRSWAKKITVDRESYVKRYTGRGNRVTLYRKARQEAYGHYLHEEGLMQKITLYKDLARTLPYEIRESYEHRADKLKTRTRYLMENRVEETFYPGRIPESLQSYTETVGKKKEVTFFTSGRTDGLSKRVEIVGEKCIHYYTDREDHLIYRSIRIRADAKGEKGLFILPGTGLGDVTIVKMTEKFARDPSKKADEDIARCTYYLREGEIRVQYHYGPGRITISSRLYRKNKDPSVEVTMADPHAVRPSDAALQRDMTERLQAEKNCYQAARQTETEINELLQFRMKEEDRIILEREVWDRAHEKTKTESKEEKSQQEAVKNDPRIVDYLTPFLPKTLSKSLSKEDAQKHMDSCLRTLKERLVERANIIQGRLDEENAQLAKKQAAFQRGQRSSEAGGDEEFEQFCANTMFRIQILEQRLNRHEETALKKYSALEKALSNDPRLAALHS